MLLVYWGFYKKVKSWFYIKSKLNPLRLLSILKQELATLFIRKINEVTFSTWIDP